jgi:hypothetical protein
VNLGDLYRSGHDIHGDVARRKQPNARTGRDFSVVMIALNG